MEGYARHVKASLSPDQALEMQAVDALAARLLAHIASTADEDS